MTPAPKQPVEYDGYYFVDAVGRSGHRVTIPARGFNLKSWVNFEKSLGSAVEFRQVTEAEWMKTHWTQIPYVEETPVKAVKKSPAKKAVKKAVKKAPAKKAVVKKAAPKKAPAKKAAPKKTVKKPAAKKAAAKKTTKVKK